MKQKIMGIAILSALILGCTTGCKSPQTTDNSSTNDATSNSISDVKDEPETTTVEATEEATEAVSDSDGGSSGGNNSGDYKAVDEVKKDENKDIIYDNLRLVPAPDAEPTHPDINFGLVTYNEKEFDVFDIDVETFEEYVNRASCSFEATHNTDDFYFYGVPFVSGECYLELITPQNTITRDNTTSKDVLYPCDIKGIMFKEGRNLYFHEGITVGTSEIEVEELLGKGIIGCTYIDEKDNNKEKRTVIYKSKTTTMVIVYLDGLTIQDKVVGYIDRIFVLEND